jgi:hypothetical protein
VEGGGGCIWEEILKLKLRGGNKFTFSSCLMENVVAINTLTPELNPSAQRCLRRFITGDFAS